MAILFLATTLILGYCLTELFPNQFDWLMVEMGFQESEEQ